MKNLTLKSITSIGLLLLEGTQMSTAMDNKLSIEIFRPKDVLADGQNFIEKINPLTQEYISLRKGTIRTMILNRQEFNKVIQEDINSTEKKNIIQEIIDTLSASIDSLVTAEIFDFFEPMEWLQNPKDEGRVLIGVLYHRINSSKLTPEIAEQLKYLKKEVSQELQQEIELCLTGTPLDIERAKNNAEVALRTHSATKVLPNGVNESELIDPLTNLPIIVRMGTVLSTWRNIQTLNNYFSKTNSEILIQDSPELNDIRHVISSYLPSLRAIGMFDLFSPKEWQQNPNQLGRAYVARLLSEVN